MKKILLICSIATALFFCSCATVSTIDYSRIFVPEEGGSVFTKITNEKQETLSTPNVRIDDNGRMRWWNNPSFAISKDGTKIAYNVFKNDRRNIFVRELNKMGGATQRTFRNRVNDVCFSPDAKTICFTQVEDKGSYIFLTDAQQGAVVQQVSTPGVEDYGPCYSLDGKQILFSRRDGDNYFIWSYDINSNIFRNYCYGIAPQPINDEEFVCVRVNSNDNFEIWRINFVKGTESVILSQDERSFSTASVSPDGKWILCVSSSMPDGQKSQNLDIYVVRIDGSQLTQLTYHRGNDCSPVWSSDGKKIYFLSQRGTENGEYNIWSMDFKLK